ncbi:DUF3560 domain-containing protein (plasmid) [Leisingera aquaemixtae]|uniref:DUF3560 domain-containing protein n=1 Tax=Leisingera aquaemixtae TaxID=1396826 RepID=A0ABY5WRF6_9RHOB|nr:DUF3560 domain-containing protein [Leisingera aquaemixtae]UWQ44033.1 DUF3560 domain-containing protein [Leisingera aquaemixtae]
MITATYSPEDNKIRLYPSARLDDETFQRVKDAGFKWAPKQELFVAPKWSCKREDLALELAGEIEPEEMTVAERAQAKAARLDALADKRAAESSAYSRAADELSRAFEFGQPILVGHHSERKARKTQERMHNAMDKAVRAHKAIGYWHYRAEGVERFANMKNDPKVRARRIKTLLAELRDFQRRLNGAHKALENWEKLTTDNLIRMALGRSEMYSFNLYSAVERGDMTPQEAREKAMAGARSIIESDNLARWISHTLNRLSYEREMLGEVPRFEGEITPTLLQMFVREHGADKPKGAKVDSDLFTVECKAPLPAHIAQGTSVELSGDEWRDLMQSCGYVPPAKKPAKPPILNFKAASGKISVVNPYRREEMILPQVELTKAEYAKIHSEQRGTRLSTCGNYRVRVAPNPQHEGPRYSAGWAAILITDQKQHEAPASFADMEAAQ